MRSDVFFELELYILDMNGTIYKLVLSFLDYNASLFGIRKLKMNGSKIRKIF